MHDVILIVVVLVFSLLLYRGIFRPSDGNAHVRPKAKSKAPCGYQVVIRVKGRCGDIIYSEEGIKAEFYWEFGGGVLVIIDIPSESHWVNELKFPVSRRKEIAERVAREVIRQKAPNCSFLWVENMIQIIE